MDKSVERSITVESESVDTSITVMDVSTDSLSTVMDLSTDSSTITDYHSNCDSRGLLYWFWKWILFKIRDTIILIASPYQQ